MADEDISTQGVLGPVLMIAGDGLRIPVQLMQWIDPEDEAAGIEPMDVSDWSWTSQWRPTESSTRSIDFTVDDSEASIGKLVLTMTGAQTRTAGSAGVYDIEGNKVGEQPWTPIRGTTVWQPDVTRA